VDLAACWVQVEESTISVYPAATDSRAERAHAVEAKCAGQTFNT
jgi:hypothetical protein